MPNTSGLVKKTDLVSKILELKNKITSITGSFTTAAFYTKVREIENKISNGSGLIKKTDWCKN